MSHAAAAQGGMATGPSGHAPGHAPGPKPGRPQRSRAARLFASLRPGSLPGPVFEKEIRVSGRRAGVYWVRGLSALGLFGLAGLVYLATFESWGGSAASLQNLQTVAPAVMIAIMWFQFIVLTLVAMASAAPLICDEKRSGTLAALLTTPLTSWQILMGKSGAMLANLGVLALVPMPLLLAARMFGGIPTRIVVASAVLTLSSAMLGAMLGLFHSAKSRRATGAAAKAIVTWALLQFGVPLAMLLANSWFSIRINEVWYARSSGPIALFSVQWLLMGGPGPFASLADELWITSSLWMLALAGLFFVGASLRLRGVMSGDSASSAPETAPSKRRRGSVHAAIVSREVSDHPVAWREIRQRAFRSRLGAGLVLLGLPGLAVLIALYGLIDSDGYFYVSIVVLTFATALLSSIGAASGLAGEKESRTLDVLLATPLTARAIIFGKVLGTARRVMLLPVIASVTIGVVGVLSGECNPILTIHLLMIYTGVVLAASGTGVLFSVVCGRTVLAMALNLATWVSVWALIPILLMILLSISGGPGTESILSVIALTNPLAVAMLAANSAVDWPGAFTESYEIFNLGRVGIVGYTVSMLVFGAVYAAIGLFFMTVAATILAERTGRRK